MNPFKTLINKIKGNTIGNRKVTRARFLYLYVIFGGIGGLLYFFASIAFDLPGHWALTPLYLLVAFIAYRFLAKNWKMIWMFVKDMEQGRLLLFLNDNTHWSEDHKLRVIKWVYLSRETIRQETKSSILNGIMEGEELDKKDKERVKFKSVFCPQQLKEAFNMALLVNALIYCHENIQVLDDDLREIMDLTDTHILAFDIKKEHDKCQDDKYQKMMKAGKKAAELLNEEK